MKLKNKEFNNNLFIAISSNLKYSYTKRFVLADVMYHCIKHGYFNTAPQASTNRTGVNRWKSLAAINEFIADGILIKIVGQQPDHIAVKFNDQSENIFHHALNSAYHATFNKSKKSVTDGISIVKTNVNKLPNGKAMEGKKAEAQRCLLVMKCFFRDKLSNNALNDSEPQWNAKYYTEIAKTTALCVNTIVKIINSFIANRFITTARNARKLIISISTIVGANGFRKLVMDKAMDIRDKLNENSRKTFRQRTDNIPF